MFDNPELLRLNPELRALKKKGTATNLHVRTATGPGNEHGFRSDLEARAWREWVPTQNAASAHYEPIVVHLTGGNYTPDFGLEWEDARPWFIEVKPSFKAHLSGRSSLRHLKQAAVEMAWLGRWFALMPLLEESGWQLLEARRIGIHQVRLVAVEE